jgi:PA domain.
MVPASQDSIDLAAETISAEAILNHVEILASDSLEGRAPATPGEEMTVDYIIKQLKAKGVEPGMPDGNYIQEFPLLGQRVDGSKASMQIKNGGRVAGDLEYSAEFMAWPSNEEERVTLEDAELVYVGYGIQAPEYDWDDYKGVDVSGKVLVFKNSDPAYDDELFEGDARLYYGRWSYKFEKAAEMGALGALIIHTTPTAGYPWLVVSNSWGRERLR